jgi:multidrug efflux pump subunit AcrA (membrane-fusion protein)
LLEKNQYQLENTVKDVEYQDLYLKLSRISSPINGVLVQSPVTVANVQVSAADTWVVVDPSSLYFSADLDETDLKRVSVGQTAHVNLDAFADLEIDSKISHISFSPKETTTGTTYEVKIGLSETEISNLRLGLNGTAALVLSEVQDALTLPMSAVLAKNGGSFVTVNDGTKYIEKEIKTGIENNGVVEIKSGLGEADNVYIKK